MPVLKLPPGQVIQVPNMRLPDQKSQGACFLFDFNGATTLEGDLQFILQSGTFDIVQAIWIDNKDNASTFSITFPSGGPQGFTVQAQPFSQGFYPITLSVGDGRFTATAPDGEQVPVVFYNVPLPFVTWGPVPGVLVVPALTLLAINIAALTVGDNVLVAGVGLQRIRLYRLGLAVDSPTNLKFFSGSGAGTLLYGTSPLTAGGSLTMQASGVPWMNCLVGQDLVMTASAAALCGGQIGYTQS